MRGLVLGLLFFSLLPLIIFKSPFIGILMWFWVSLMNPQAIVWGGPFSALNYALIVAIITLICGLFSAKESKLPPLNKTTILLLLMAAWISVTSINGLGQFEEIYFWWAQAEKMLLMTLLAYAWTNTRKRLDQLIVVCVLSISIFGVRGGLGTLVTGGANRVFGPEGSMIGDNNDLGVALTMMLPLLLHMLQRYRQFYAKWSLVAVIALTFIGDVFTYSRGAIVALCAMGGMVWLRSRQKIQIAILIIVALVGVWSFAPAAWFDRMSTIGHYSEDESAETRIYVWQLSWQMGLKHPLVGAGFHWSHDYTLVNQELSDTGLPQLTRARAPHSIWFQMLSEHGILGLVIFIAILGSATLDARWLIRHSRNRSDLRWADNLGRMLHASLIGFAIGGSFATLAFYDGFYAIVIIGASARRVVASKLAQEAATSTKTEGRAILPPIVSLRPQPTGNGC